MPNPCRQAARLLRSLCQCLAPENAQPASMQQVFATTSRCLPRTPCRIQVLRFVREYRRVPRAAPLLDSRRRQRNLDGCSRPDFDILGIVAGTPELADTFGSLIDRQLSGNHVVFSRWKKGG